MSNLSGQNHENRCKGYSAMLLTDAHSPHTQKMKKKWPVFNGFSVTSPKIFHLFSGTIPDLSSKFHEDRSDRLSERIHHLHGAITLPVGLNTNEGQAGSFRNSPILITFKLSWPVLDRMVGKNTEPCSHTSRAYLLHTDTYIIYIYFPLGSGGGVHKM